MYTSIWSSCLRLLHEDLLYLLKLTEITRETKRNTIREHA